MKAKKNKRERSAHMQQVSAGLQDVLGMTQWRKEHPKATWQEIEAAVDERINQLRAQMIQDIVQMSDGASGNPGSRGGGVGGARGRGQASQARGAASTCRSGQTSDECGWSHGAVGGGRVGRSQDAGNWGGDAQSARRSAYAAPLLL